MRRVISVALVSALMTLGMGVFGSPASAAWLNCTSSSSRTAAHATDFDGDPMWGSVPVRNGDYHCNVKRGMTGSLVTSLQLMLNKCFGESLKPDGSFGSLTEAAVRRMQGSVGAGIDGQFGPQTKERVQAKGRWRVASGNYPNQGACDSLSYL